VRRIYLRNAANTRVLDASDLEHKPTGCHPDVTRTARRLAELATLTPGTTNSALLIRDIVIQRNLYHPISLENGGRDLSSSTIGAPPRSIWPTGGLQGGISFNFPPQASIPAGGYLVWRATRPRLLSRYPT